MVAVSRNSTLEKTRRPLLSRMDPITPSPPILYLLSSIKPTLTSLSLQATASMPATMKAHVLNIFFIFFVSYGLTLFLFRQAHRSPCRSAGGRKIVAITGVVDDNRACALVEFPVSGEVFALRIDAEEVVFGVDFLGSKDSFPYTCLANLAFQPAIIVVRATYIEVIVAPVYASGGRLLRGQAARRAAGWDCRRVFALDLRDAPPPPRPRPARRQTLPRRPRCDARRLPRRNRRGGGAHPADATHAVLGGRTKGSSPGTGAKEGGARDRGGRGTLCGPQR